MVIENNVAAVKQLLNEIHAVSPYLAMVAIQVIWYTSDAWNRNQLLDTISSHYKKYNSLLTPKTSIFYQTIAKGLQKSKYRFGLISQNNDGILEGIKEFFLFNPNELRKALLYKD